MPIYTRTTGTSALEGPSNQQNHLRQPANSKRSFWQEVISRVASEAGIDPGLAVNVAKQESSLNPRAVNHSSGAVGLMQLTARTAASLGVNPHDVVANIRGGVHYLRQQLSKFGDEAKALAAYNWGPHHVSQAVKRWGSDWLSHAPPETQRYVNSILARTGVPEPSRLTTAALNQVSAPASVSSAATSHLKPSVSAESGCLRSAFDAYLLSDSLT